MMSKKDILQKPKANGTPLDSSSKLEVIKNLIFGDNIEAYNAEFDALKKDIQSKRKELEQLMGEVRGELNQQIDSLSTDLNIRVSDLENALEDRMENLQTDKVDRAVLGKLLIDLGEKISKK